MTYSGERAIEVLAEDEKVTLLCCENKSLFGAQECVDLQAGHPIGSESKLPLSPRHMLHHRCIPDGLAEAWGSHSD